LHSPPSNLGGPKTFGACPLVGVEPLLIRIFPRRYVMSDHPSAGKELMKGAGSFLGHVLALVLGLVLMIGGVALGVTLVALPLGIAVGFAGLLLAMWGLFGWAQEKKSAAQPPSQP
jgi:hypothetical protein